jgi:hypothetical protein
LAWSLASQLEQLEKKQRAPPRVESWRKIQKTEERLKTSIVLIPQKGKKVANKLLSVLPLKIRSTLVAVFVIRIVSWLSLLGFVRQRTRRRKRK